MGIKTIMITGDNPLTDAAIAAEAGVDDFLAEATPEGKRSFVHVMKSRMVYIERAVHRIGVERAALLGDLLNEFVDALVSVSEEEGNLSLATEEKTKC